MMFRKICGIVNSVETRILWPEKQKDILVNRKRFKRFIVFGKTINVDSADVFYGKDLYFQAQTFKIVFEIVKNRT